LYLETEKRKMAQAGIALGHTVIDLSSDSDSEDDGRQVEASVIDLTNIPDIDIPPNKPRPMNDQSHGNPDRGGGVGLITEAACLQMVLDVLPAISVDYVLNLIQNKTTDQTRSVAQCEQIILQLLEGTHPTEADAVNQKKRKREDEDENISRMARGEYRQPCFYENDA
jgi:TRIAD3 protein (E3 ubiquitin-protein ligase RNF216)